MNKPTVFVTRRWPSSVEARLSQLFEPTFNEKDKALSASELVAAMQSHDALLPTVTDKIDNEIIACENAQARIIGNYGVGFSHIDVEAAKQNGITVTNTPDVLSECTADITLTLMLMVSRRAGEGERELRAGEWTGWRPTHMVGRKMSGKTLGIIGFGRIGQEVAKRAHFGFGMKVIALGRSAIRSGILESTGATQADDIDELLAASDYVSLHCPGGDANHHLINAARLQQMKSSSYLINTARGEVVDDVALCAALDNGTIAGAGLDVFEGEPAINPCLLDCKNAVLLPHLGSATQETREAMGFRVIDNLIAFFDGNSPPDKVA